MDDTDITAAGRAFDQQATLLDDLLISIESELKQLLEDQPIGLAAAISELRTCKEYPEYLKAIVDQYSRVIDLGDAILDWSLQRAAVWSTAE